MIPQMIPPDLSTEQDPPAMFPKVTISADSCAHLVRSVAFRILI